VCDSSLALSLSLQQIYVSYVGDGPNDDGSLRSNLLIVPVGVSAVLLVLGFVFVYLTRMAL
jgi:hypothetical protein